MQNTKIVALSKEFCLFLLLLNHWAVCQVTLKKTLKRIALSADGRNYQPQGHAIAFDRLAVGFRGDCTRIVYNVACTSPVTPTFAMFWANSILGNHCELQEWSHFRGFTQ